MEKYLCYSFLRYACSDTAEFKGCGSIITKVTTMWAKAVSCPLRLDIATSIIY
jgi:hypothetical protein